MYLLAVVITALSLLLAIYYMCPLYSLVRTDIRGDLENYYPCINSQVLSYIHLDLGMVVMVACIRSEMA